MKIKLMPYDPGWLAEFERIRSSLESALSRFSPTIEHIGSTAIPGLCAKPVIDIQIGLPCLETFDADGGIDAVESLGYPHRADLLELVPFRRFFQIRPTEKKLGCNIHLVEIQHPWWRRHLLFRDYLRKSPTARGQYEAAKKELAKKGWLDVNEYADAKTEVVLRLEEEAFDYFELSPREREFVKRGR